MNKLHSLIEKSVTMPLAALLLFAINVGSLVFALTMQFGFEVRPCYLCLWQRVPYLLAAIVSLLAFFSRPYKRQTFSLLCLCFLLYVGSIGASGFHSGVERRWWKGTDTCSNEEIKGSSIEEMRQALLQQEEPRCDEIPWSIFGLSMTNLNFAASIAFAVFAAMAAARQKRSFQR